ncbi:MAG: prepilin-type cleavage/methylation domain-containing protein [Betaproteobacteria bacterium]
MPLQAQRQQLFQSQTENTLETAKKALLGYAQSQGRLPCPATSNGTGVFPDDEGSANPNASGICTQQIGFLPASTLGIQSIDEQGFALDGWGNRIRYAVTQANSSAFTTTDSMNVLGLTALVPDIRVCATSTALNCTATINLTNNAVAVIYSLGATGAQASGGGDEAENLNAIANVDTVFVSHEARLNDPVNGEFDHIVTWISPYVLYNAMIEAGQLH